MGHEGFQTPASLKQIHEYNESLKKKSLEKDQYFFGHGKLLISGEYFVLDGTYALALPTKLGQSLSVKYSPSFSPVLTWNSYDVDGNLWLKCQFEFWHFKCLDENPSPHALFLQKLLKEIRKQNPHFLRDDVDVTVQTRLGFPLPWGLGSSSSLIYNVAQWAYVSPFELLFKTYGGSGYDIACAQSEAPILYRKTTSGPLWKALNFNPSFKNQLYFVYRGQKADTKDAIKEYQKMKSNTATMVAELSELTHQMIAAKSLDEFRACMRRHEYLVGKELDMVPVKELLFSDFDGDIKSLGAWGGDFMLVATELEEKKMKEYFMHKKFTTVIKYTDLISDPIENFNRESFVADQSILQ